MLLIVPGLTGVAGGAFHQASSPWFVAIKQRVAVWLVQGSDTWPLEQSLPWWLLANYPASNDALSILDRAVLLFYIAAIAAAVSLAVLLPLILAAASSALGAGSASIIWSTASCRPPPAA